MENKPAFPRPGAPAVPGSTRPWRSGEQEGMTLREYYAGQAMLGLLMGNGIALAVDAGTALEVHDFEGVIGKVVRIAWRMADVMCLEGGPPPPHTE